MNDEGPKSEVISVTRGLDNCIRAVLIKIDGNNVKFRPENNITSRAELKSACKSFVDNYRFTTYGSGGISGSSDLVVWEHFFLPDKKANAPMNQYAMIKDGVIQRFEAADEASVKAALPQWQYIVRVDDLSPKPKLGWSFDGSKFIDSAPTDTGFRTVIKMAKQEVFYARYSCVAVFNNWRPRTKSEFFAKMGPVIAAALFGWTMGRH